MNDDTITISRTIWEETLDINRRLHGILRGMTNGISYQLRELARTASDDEQRERLLRLIAVNATMLKLLDDMAFQRMVDSF